MDSLNHEEKVFLTDLELLLNNSNIDELMVMKLMARLLFIIFRQLTKIPYYFQNTNNKHDENMERTIHVLRTEINNLRENPYYENNYIVNTQHESNISQNNNDLSQPQHQEQQQLLNQSAASINNHISTMQRKLQAQIALEKQSILHALESNNLIKPIDFEPDLFKACKEGKISSVRWLIEKEDEEKDKPYEDENNYMLEFYENDTPIHIAAKHNNPEIVKYLIEKRRVSKEIKGWQGKTALHYASEKGHAQIVEYLLSKKANINAKDDYGWTPLHYACSSGQLEIVKILISAGAKINERDNTFAGWTPLHLASLVGNIDIVNYLITNNANKKLKDKIDQTPFDWAQKDDIRNILQ